MDETKPNNLASLLRDFAQGASNSVASNVAVPVDAIAWLLRKGGVNVPPNPVMGSDWMAEKGLTREPQNKLAGFAGDMAGMVAPFAAAAKAPKIARGLLQAGENLATPNAMKNAGQRGAINLGNAPKFPQSESLDLAQQRAALPISENGLGLPANNTAMDRANAMFPTDVYHGGSSDIRAPSYDFSGKGHDQYGSAALYTATNPTLASGYAEKALEGANVMPLRINTKGFVSDTNVPNLTATQIAEMIKKSPDKDAIYNFGDVDYEGLNKVIGNAVKEYKSVSDDGLSQLNMLSNDFYPNNPAEFNKGISKLTGIRGVTADVGAGEKFHMPWHEDDIRSRFAAFDPWRRNAAIAAAMGVAAPDLLAKDNNELASILKSRK